jgi:tetratricopeptide (TPR) repeat protein
MRDVNKAIMLDPKMPEPYFIRATLKADNKEYDEAISDLSKALKLDPGYAEVYCVRATIYELKGEGKLAMMDYQMAAMLGNKKTQEFLKSEGIGWSTGGTEGGPASKN